MRILVVEDDENLNRQLSDTLKEAGYVVDQAFDGEEGHFLGDTEPYDAVVLDIGLPEMDGITVLEKWRAAGRVMPVLILTARDRWSDKVAGIDAGADDYVAKPFHIEEVLARLRALIRRAAGHASSDLICGPVRLDTKSSKATVDGVTLKLTSHEFRLLSYLMHHMGEVVSRTELTEHLYDQDFDRDSNTIEVFVGRLRKKMGVDMIETVRGLGYRMQAPPNEARDMSPGREDGVGNAIADATRRPVRFGLGDCRPCRDCHRHFHALPARCGKEFPDLLRAHLFNVVNSVSINENRQLTGRPELGDLQFSQPGTGWYWIAEGVGQYKTTPLVSPSLGATPLPEKSVSEVPFDIRFQRFYDMKDTLGNNISVAETEVELDDQGDIVRFRVTGNKAVVEASVSAFNRSLYLALTIFGAGSLLANALAILIGLRPLDRVRNALENIRAGRAERLEGRFPSEIRPLANEVNALIDNNRRIIERARMQVGNLAHSLKTPIAVLINEAHAMTPAHGALVKQQAEAMQSQVQSYLNRARIAAQRETVLARTEARPVLDRIVRVMQKLNRELEFEMDDSAPARSLRWSSRISRRF